MHLLPDIHVNTERDQSHNSYDLIIFSQQQKPEVQNNIGWELLQFHTILSFQSVFNLA